MGTNEASILRTSSYRCLSGIMDSFSDFVFFKDTNNSIIRANSAVAASLGVDADLISGTHSARWYPEAAERFYQDDLRVIRSGSPLVGQSEALPGSSGEIVQVSTDKFPLLSDDGEAVGVLAICRRRLVPAPRPDTVGLGMLHDLNNALALAMGHATTQAFSIDWEPQVVGREISDAITHAASASKQLGRWLSGDPDLNVESSTTVCEILDSAVRLIDPLVPNRVNLTLDCHAGETELSVDVNRILDVLVNLLLNAFEATPIGGKVTLRSVKDQNTSCVRFSVLDSGVGISPSLHHAIFDPGTSTKSETGRGLGLYRVATIVREHGGDVTCNSSPDGTEISFQLPIAPGRE